MSGKSKLWYLENFNLFESIKPERMKYLGEMTSMLEFPKNNPIYFAKEPSKSIYFLKEGRVKLTRIDDEGKEMIMALVNPGEVFGEMSILDEGERTDFAYAMDNCLICAISKDDFKNFIESNPELNLKLTKIIGFRLKKYSERIENLVFKDSEQRVANFLLNMALEQGEKVGEEYFVKPFLTHQDIASLTACSRQTVNAVLSKFREMKIIDFDRKKLILRREEELLKFI